MQLVIEQVSAITPQLVAEINALLPELSTSAPPLSEQGLREVVEAPCTTLFIARWAGTLVGTLTLVSFRIPTGQRAWIEDVVVSAQSRGLGIGERLCQAAIDQAMALGAVSIDLTSRPARLAANRLYQKLGFRPRETNVYRLNVGRR